MALLEKIQALPEEKRKIIFWLVLILIGILAFVFWLWRASYFLKNLSGEQFLEGIGFPELKNEEFGDLKEDWDELQDVQETLDDLNNGEISSEDLEKLNEEFGEGLNLE